MYSPYVNADTFAKDLDDDIKRIANTKDKDVVSLPVVSPIKEVHVMHKEIRQGQLWLLTLNKHLTIKLLYARLNPTGMMTCYAELRSIASYTWT